MFVVTVVFEVSPGHAGTFREAVIAQARASLTEAGCRQFDVGADARRPGRFLLYEVYESAEAFDVHLATPHFAHFDAITRRQVLEKTVETWHLVETPTP